MNPIRPALRISVYSTCCTRIRKGNEHGNYQAVPAAGRDGRHSLLAAALAPHAFASSHREAPFITRQPKVDATDFYMFRSYEPGREKFVTLIANYFAMDPDALYEIHIDNNGDAREDISFQFCFSNTNKDTQLTVGGKKMSIPLVINGGAVNDANPAGLNVRETYSVTVRGQPGRDLRPDQHQSAGRGVPGQRRKERQG